MHCDSSHNALCLSVVMVSLDTTHHLVLYFLFWLFITIRALGLTFPFTTIRELVLTFPLLFENCVDSDPIVIESRLLIF